MINIKARYTFNLFPAINKNERDLANAQFFGIERYNVCRFVEFDSNGCSPIEGLKTT
jgi:hypothetical protein